ncbi:hypothetical protein A0U89_11825 [Kozakia baliensis]|uniref:Uncharacterized protein n=1 Tax=Kozakia baliensis TaxID=153496 RepID=A0A1D8UVN7_9PROT|nr:hypothetical protein A0U89_11825 [Kozakia baliensis]
MPYERNKHHDAENEEKLSFYVKPHSVAQKKKMKPKHGAIFSKKRNENFYSRNLSIFHSHYAQKRALPRHYALLDALSDCRPGKYFLCLKRSEE